MLSVPNCHALIITVSPFFCVRFSRNWSTRRAISCRFRSRPTWIMCLTWEPFWRMQRPKTLPWSAWRSWRRTCRMWESPSTVYFTLWKCLVDILRWMLSWQWVHVTVWPFPPRYCSYRWQRSCRTWRTRPCQRSWSWRSSWCKGTRSSNPSGSDWAFIFQVVI